MTAYPWRAAADGIAWLWERTAGPWVPPFAYPPGLGRWPGAVLLFAFAALELAYSEPADPRSLANPLVAGDFGLRFYAGVPLRTSDGYNLGTLCIIDKEARPVSQDEIDELGLAELTGGKALARLGCDRHEPGGDVGLGEVGVEGELDHAPGPGREGLEGVGDEHPAETAKALGARGIFVWDGDYYAREIMVRLGLFDTGGAELRESARGLDQGPEDRSACQSLLR